MRSDPITRHHVDVQGRDVHYRRRGNGPPVLLLHASPRSGAALVPLMAAAPDGLAVLAFDTPGCGDSAPLDIADPGPDDFAAALADTLDALGIGRAAVYGTHTGAAIALAFALRCPDRVASLVLDGLSLFDAAERARLLGDYLPPFAQVADGSHLTRLWSRVRDQQLFFPWHEIATRNRLWRPLPDAAQLQAVALDLLRAGDAYRGPYRAAIGYRPGGALARLRVPTRVGARPDDVLHSHLARLPTAPANVRIETLPAEAGAWADRVWSALCPGTETSAPAPAPVDTLPTAHVGSAIVGRAGERIHLRGALGGKGRPRVVLHDSPGSARLLEARIDRCIGERPVLAPDLPGHGDSDDADADAVARIDAALRACGVDAADVEGVSAGSVVAAALARLDPARYRAPPVTPPGPDAFAAPSMPPRADGGHLIAAWLHARDEAILGPAWTADATRRHDFGDAIDVAAVHRHCIAALVEAPSAAAFRRSLLAAARIPRG